MQVIIEHNIASTQRALESAKEAERFAKSQLIRHIEMIQQEVEDYAEEAITQINKWKAMTLKEIDDAACREDAAISYVSMQFQNDLDELVTHRDMCIDGTLERNLAH